MRFCSLRAKYNIYCIFGSGMQKLKRLLSTIAFGCAAMSSSADATFGQASIPVEPPEIVWNALFLKSLVLVKAHPDARLIWMGDSITASWEHSSGHGYDNILPLWIKYYAPYGALDLAISGDNTSNLIWRLDHGQVAGLHPQLVIILIGANNLKEQHWGASETIPGIEKVVSVTRASLPRSHILLLGILPAAWNPWGHHQISIINATLATDYAGDPNVTFIDAGSALLKDGRPDPNLYLEPKLIPPRGPFHPNAFGMARIAAFLEPDIERFMK